MRAVSLLGTISALDSAVTDGMEITHLSQDGQTRHIVERCQMILESIAVLSHSVFDRLPSATVVPEEVPPIKELIKKLYVEPGLMECNLHSSLLRCAKECQSIVWQNQHVVIPLTSQHPFLLNWAPLLEFCANRLTVIGNRLSTLAHRVKLDDDSSSGITQALFSFYSTYSNKISELFSFARESTFLSVTRDPKFQLLRYHGDSLYSGELNIHPPNSEDILNPGRKLNKKYLFLQE